MKASFKNLDDYLALQPEKVVIALERIRKIIKSAAPDANELISYGMPAFKLYGKMLMYFAGFKNHCSLFPGSKFVILKFKKELKAFKTSAGTISFTVEKPLPTSLIKKIVKARIKENLDKMNKKIKTKQTQKK